MAALENYETRLLRIQSRDRQDPLTSTANFSVSFGNEAQEFADRVMGVGVESVIFPNFLSTFQGDESKLTVTVFGSDGYDDTYIIDIGPTVVGGLLTTNLGQFVSTLQQAWRDTVYAGDPEVTITATGPSPAGNTIRFTFTSAAGTAFMHYKRDSLLYIIGVPDNASHTINWNMDGGPYDYRTNLNGMNQIYLHSERLTAGRLGLDARNPTQSHSITWSCLVPIPITVPYGFLQSLDNTQQSMFRPTITYGPHTSLDLSNIDISLRDSEQNLIDIGTGEVTVILRVWRYNR